MASSETTKSSLQALSLQQGHEGLVCVDSVFSMIDIRDEKISDLERMLEEARKSHLDALDGLSVVHQRYQRELDDCAKQRDRAQGELLKRAKRGI